MNAGRDFSTRHDTTAQPAMAVLFVDPDIAGARTLAQSIEGRCAVAVVSSGREALAAIYYQVPDLVVTEFDLPDMGGLELLTRIHETAETRHTLLMVITKRASARDKVAAFQAGADDFLIKPLTTERFDRHLRLVSRFRKIIR